jgi:putative lipoic acid-binding regulatory protein
MNSIQSQKIILQFEFSFEFAIYGMVKNILTLNFFKVTIKQRLQDQYIQKWFSDINNSSRGEYYSKFKTEFKLENYLLRLNAVHRNYICKLRTSNIKFHLFHQILI